MRTFEWTIEDIVSAHPDLYLEHCAVMAVALLAQRFSAPCEFLVECNGFRAPAFEEDMSFLLRVGWMERTEEAAARIRLTEQPRPITERAAVARTALVLADLVPDGEIRTVNNLQRLDRRSSAIILFRSDLSCLSQSSFQEADCHAARGPRGPDPGDPV